MDIILTIREIVLYTNSYYLLEEEFIKNITRLSLALIIFSLFSISYLVTSATAQTSKAPMGQPGNPGMLPTSDDSF